MSQTSNILLPKKVNEANSLYAKLAAIFSILVLVVGGTALLLGYQSMSNYYQEITQELNKDIAMYMASNYSLNSQDNQQNTIELARISERSMVLNPSIEVYLLNNKGVILDHNQAPEAIKLTQIALHPIKEFLTNDRHFPLRGSNPKSSEELKIFSVFPLQSEQQTQGYVYVILGGQLFDNIAASISSSYVLKTSFNIAIILIIATLVIGLLAFKTITLRLSKLTNAMLEFSCDAPHTVTIDSKQKRTIDEIDLLALHFKKLTGKIEDQFKHLKEADIHRRELVSNISHDLRTPLAVSKGYIETLCIKNNQLSQAQRLHYLHIAQRSIEQLAVLIDDLFELSKLEAGQIELKCEAFSLLELIYDTVQEFEILSANKNITIHVPSPTHNVLVCADIALIQRVFANLIANAIKFTPQDGSVSIDFSVDEAKITIVISDTGCGIADQDISRIFDRYYFKKQSIGSRQRSQAIANKEPCDMTSSGLGLAIVKKILELHDSRIKVSNLDTRGSQFQFQLPAA